MPTHRHTPSLPLTRERLLTILDDVLASPDVACLERVRLAITGASAHDLHARTVRDLIAMRMREVDAPDIVPGPRGAGVPCRRPPA